MTTNGPVASSDDRSTPLLAHPTTALATLVEHLAALGFSTGSLREDLGAAAVAQAHAANPAGAQWLAARWLAEQGSVAGDTDSAPSSLSPRALAALGVFLRSPLSASDWETILGDAVTVEDLVKEQVLLSVASETETKEESFRLNVDIRPVAVPPHGTSEILIASDPDSAYEQRTPPAEHVPGVGNAPLSLLNVIPPLNEVFSGPFNVLDLGTGSGVIARALSANYPEAQVTGTDISTRALDFARAGFGGDAGWVEGNWFEPLAGRQFDLIVSNPPFVITPDSDHVYRESGLELDGASRLVVEESARHLSPGGYAHLLAAWALGPDEAASSRIGSWFPSQGIRAWVVQRDEVDVADYVATWIADESIDLRSAEGQALTRRWLDFFAERGIERIGMGWVHMHRLSDGTASEVTVETIDKPLPVGTYLGAETEEWFLRAEWLATKDGNELLDTSFAVRPTTAIHRVDVAGSAENGSAGMPGSTGFTEFRRSVSRTDGPAWEHDIDEPLQAILAGLHPEGLSLREVCELYTAVQQLDSEALLTAIVPIIVDLVRHGLVIPADLL